MAAIYARISQDRDGLRAGVDRQVEECRALAARLGWQIGAVYADDDVSAFSGRRRPEYERMLRGLRDGTVDGVLVWHPDRLHRRPRELEAFIQLVEAHDFHVATVQTGEYDLSTPTGRAIARTLGAWAAHESEHKGERVKSAIRQRVEQGLPNGGVRPYGYESDGMKVRREEAAVIRKVAKRVIAGESLASIAQGLNDQGVPTAQGKQWRVTTLKNMITGYRLCGIRAVNDVPQAKAAWSAILTADQTNAIRGLLLDPARKRTRAPRRYLLAGLLRCAKCGTVLVSQPQGERRRYACKPRTGMGGCGGTYIEADAIEEIVTEAVLFRLDDARLGQAPDGEDGKAAELELLALNARLDEFTDMLAKGELDRQAYNRARTTVQASVDTLQKSRASSARSGSVEALLAKPGQLRRQWPNLPLARQQAIVKAVMQNANIGPAVLGLGQVSPDRFQPQWRV